MSVFRARDDQANFFDFRSQNLANDFFFGGYGRSASASSPSAAILTPGPNALLDNIPGNTSTSFTLTVDATPTISAVDTIGDEDFYRITLIAGHQYQIGMYGYTPQGPGDPAGPNGAPLLDSYIELYDAAGVLITSADGGSDTVFNTANSGFDALMTFTATTTGTYYVNARAFDNVPADGDNGDVIGDYGLYAEDVTGDESLYTPYYSPDSPLYAIDWGTQVNKVHQTYRNPDGNEGTRDTGNAPSSVDPGLAIGQPGKNVISIYFAQAGDVFTSNDPTNPGLPPATITATGVQPFEHTAVMTALAEFSKVADVVYVEVSDRTQADFIYTSYQGTPGPGVSLLGSMSPPDESDEGLAQFNSGDSRWNATNLQQGGFSFVTLIHEFGHGHGLAHPHDNGGHSGIMNGVEPEGAGVADYTTGDFHLNQGVFTMMSYEDGWQDSPYGNAPTNVGYGYLGGLMAFDIAAIQDKYGVNEEWATGDQTYVLKDVNAAGTYYTSIWDASGNDTIVYFGSRAANIDLRAATLEYETGGGGWVSYATGIYGGFTIANGVRIENATGGSGNDTLTGNEVANSLDGGLGVDTLIGGAGDDTYWVDVAGDVVTEAVAEGQDRVFARTSYTLATGSEVELLQAGIAGAIDLTGNEGSNAIYGNDAANFLIGGGGADVLEAFGGDDTLYGGLGSDYLDGGAGADVLESFAGEDILRGGIGNDYLDGGAGGDLMIGGAGNDIYWVDAAGDVAIEAGGEGQDVVFARASYTLASGSEIEVLQAGVAGAIDLAGNELANALYGNDAANTLLGGGGSDVLFAAGGSDYLDGGTGADRMTGGTGNDIYWVDAAGDVATEAVGGGQDMVFARASYTLTAGSEIELLQAGAAGAIDLAGNELANAIYGNNAANVLNGGGGADVLAGFGGADTYAFTTAPGAGNLARVLGFESGVDKVALGRAVFTAVGGTGALDPNGFFQGTAAHDADDRIIYDSNTGALYYDADGNGAGAAIQFAALDSGLTLTASDFMVI